MPTAARTLAPRPGPKDLYEIGEVPPLGHVPAQDACLGDPQGAPRPARKPRCSSRWCRPGRSARTRCWSTSWPAGSTTTASGRGSGFRSRRSTCTSSPFHVGRLGCFRHRVGDRHEGAALEGRRRGHRPLQSGRRRRRGLQRRRSDALAPAQRIWGYETPDGSFAQFCRVQSRQLMTKPAHLTWEEFGLLHAHARHRLPHAVSAIRRTP